MKAFFRVLLAVSLLFPMYWFYVGTGDFAHNQWETRARRLNETTLPDSPSAHFGLTASQLAGLDESVSAAYKDAVNDGYRLGHGYEKLFYNALALDAVLLCASIVGLKGSREAKHSAAAPNLT
jgi:hypothetical protein